jgi:hypothetical protein
MRVRAFSFHPSIRPFLWKKKRRREREREKKVQGEKTLVDWLTCLSLPGAGERWGGRRVFKKRKKRVILGVCMKTHREDVDTGGDIMDRGSAATVATAAPSRSERLARL